MSNNSRKYTRETELRHLGHKEICDLSAILDVDNCWKRLMAAIPKRLNANKADKKYNIDDMHLIEIEFKRNENWSYYTQILFDEWSTSGRAHERPTLGVLRELLLQEELYRAADALSVNILNEPIPKRPSTGPGAEFPIPDTLIVTEDLRNIESYVNDDLNTPDTEALKFNTNNFEDINKDYYTKHLQVDKRIGLNDSIPERPPRLQRKTRLRREQQIPEQSRNEASTAEAFNNISWSNSNQQQSISHNIPKFLQLMTNASTSSSSKNSTPIENANSLMCTNSTYLSQAPIPELSALGKAEVTVSSTTAAAEPPKNHDTEQSTTNIGELLPVVSVLNINGERDTSITNRVALQNYIEDGPNSNEESQSFTSSNDSDFHNLPVALAEFLIREPPVNLNAENNDKNYDNDDDDDDDDYPYDDEEDDDDNSAVPNSSKCEDRSSSLTDVTGTSGENSFELSMNSASNENGPCLSATKP